MTKSEPGFKKIFETRIKHGMVIVLRIMRVQAMNVLPALVNNKMIYQLTEFH